VVDESKLVEKLGAFGLPLEVLPFAPGIVGQRVLELGASRVTRRAELSENGNVLLDAHFGTIEDPSALAMQLGRLPGLVEHGIFPAAMVERVIVAGQDGVRELLPTSDK
jgi:ribose 5-phosphate isomerase A